MTMSISTVTFATLGSDRRSVPTTIRSSRIAVTSRIRRISRPSRAAIANVPVAGSSATRITRKSKTFHPSRK